MNHIRIDFESQKEVVKKSSRRMSQMERNEEDLQGLDEKIEKESQMMVVVHARQFEFETLMKKEAERTAEVQTLMQTRLEGVESRLDSMQEQLDKLFGKLSDISEALKKP